MRFPAIYSIFSICLLITFANALAAQEPDYPAPPEAVRGTDVPQGKIEGPYPFKSKIYPGTERDYWIYVPAQYKADKPAAVMVVQDGLSRAQQWKMPEIFDNLIQKGEMPVMIGIFVNPGVVPSSKDGSQPRLIAALSTIPLATPTRDS